jgi:Domain of unknown function (DUF1844)
MVEDKDEGSEFRVVDRRSFAQDGSRRNPAPEAAKTSEARQAPARTSSPPVEPRGSFDHEAAFGRQAADEDYENGPANFATLVSYLSTTAMFQLGLLPGPGGERIPADFPNARRTIDLLEVLQQKTQGNLTDDEAKMLEEVLYELRLSFVETSERQTRKKR